METSDNSPKILLYDLETTPILAYVWGMWEQNVLEVVEDPYILCFSYKWLGEEETHVVSLRDFPNYKRNKKTDKNLVKKLHELLDEADIVIGQNSDRFDNKWSNKQFVKHGLDPVSPFRSIDTLKIARKHFRFDSNSLDRLGAFLGVGRKVKHEGKDLWLNVMKGDDDAWDRMIEYAKQDVVLLEKVYYKLRPYMSTHPNLNIYNEDVKTIRCPICQSTKVQKRGTEAKGRYSIAQRYKCQNCGKWGQGPTKRVKGVEVS